MNAIRSLKITSIALTLGFLTGCGGPLSHTVDDWSPASVSADGRTAVDGKQAAVEKASQKKDAAIVAADTAEAAVEDAKADLADAKALVEDIEAKLAAAQDADPVDQALIDELEAQLSAAKEAVALAEEALSEAEQTVLDIQTSHKKDIAKEKAMQHVSDVFDPEQHEAKMAELDKLVDDAAYAVEQAQKVVDDLKAQIAALVLAAADSSDPAAQARAQAMLKKLQKKLEAAEAVLAEAVDHHTELVEARDAYETKALAHKNAQFSAEDISREIAKRIAEEARAMSPGSAPGYAPGYAPSGMDTHYVKIVGPDGVARYVSLEQLVAEAQSAVDDLKAQLLRLLDLERAAAESGDAAAYAKYKKLVAALKAKLADAEKALRDAYALVAEHGYGPAAAPGMAPGMAPGPSADDKFIKVTVDGETTYVSARDAAEEARDAYEAALDKVDELKNDLLSLLAQMRAAAEAGDEALYNKLKDQVAAAKAALRLAELHAEDALAAFNKAAAAAPGIEPMAPGPSAHDSILRSDVAEAKKAMEAIKSELLDLLAQMKRAAESGDRVAYEALKKKVEALKKALALSERRLRDSEDRLNGVYREELDTSKPKRVVEVKAPPAPRYQGPPATVSVDARHVSWYDAPKGAVTGVITSEQVGSHVEVGEIENVEVYDVVPAEGIYLREGDIKLPAMRDMADEAVSVSVRLQFIRAPDNGACLFHMGNGDGDEFQIKVQDDVLTFQVSPSASAGGSSKMAVIAMEEPVSKFITGREYAIVAVLGNDGYMYLYVDGDKVAEGNGMVNPLNGFINEVTLKPRRDNYVGTCYVEDHIPLSAGIIAVDVFDGELNDLDVTMVSGSFTADEDFTTEPEVEI